MNNDSLNLKNVHSFPQSLLIVIFIWISLLILYNDIFHIPFSYEDQLGVLKNSVVISLDTFYERMVTLKGLTAKPVSVLSFALNYHFGKEDPFYYHLVNFSIHLANTSIIYFIAKKIMSFPVIAACVFAFHPLATGVATKIQGRNYSLATFFMLCALYYVLSKGFRWKLKDNIILASILFLMLLSKQSLVFCLGIVAWFFYSHIDKPKKLFKRFKFLIICISSCSLLLAITYGVRYIDTAQYSPWVFAISQLGNWFQLMLLFIFPYRVSYTYGFPPYTTILDIHVVLGLVLLTAIIIVGFKHRKTYWGFFLIATLIAIFPTNSIVPKDQFVLDWRLYPALVFYSLFLGAVFETLIKNFPPRRILVASATAALISFLIWRTGGQNFLYNDPVRTFAQALKWFPNSSTANASYAWALVQKDRLEEAEVYYKKSLALNPLSRPAIYGLRELYLVFGEEENFRHYDELYSKFAIP